MFIDKYWQQFVDNDGKLQSERMAGLADHDYLKQDIYTFTQEVYLQQRGELFDLRAEFEATGDTVSDRSDQAAPGGLAPGFSYLGCQFPSSAAHSPSGGAIMTYSGHLFGTTAPCRVCRKCTMYMTTSSRVYRGNRNG